jgi:hypothetical protein
MGTIDYCILVILLLLGLVALAVKHEGKRVADRRQHKGQPPDGIERRSGKDRRGNSLTAYVLWAMGSQWSRLRKLF